MPYKVILLGSSGVGKSNLLLRLNKNEFNPDCTSTIGVEFLGYEVGVDGERVKAQIWDTAGQERFISMMGSYYRNAKGALLVFDLTDSKTFESADLWRKELFQRASGQPVVLLVGNKSDLGEKRVIRREDAEEYARKHSMGYMETSALTGENVKQAFLDVIVGAHRLSRTPEPVATSVPNEPEDDKKVDLDSSSNGRKLAKQKQPDCC